jgi:hypothetical protein
MGSAGCNNENQADTPTVLVVEDEVLIRMATADYLRGCGYRVVEVGSGDEAVAVVATECMARPRSASGLMPVGRKQSAAMYPAHERSPWP